MKSNIDKFLNSFLSEAKDIIEKAEVAILNLENAANPEDINSIFRFIHTIKGNAGMLELGNITQLTHSMESLLGLLRNNDIKLSKEIIDVLLEGVDIVKNMLDDIHNQSTFNINNALTKINSFIKTDSKENLAVGKDQRITNSKLFEVEELEDFKKLAVENKSYITLVNLNLNEQKLRNLSEFIYSIEKISNWILKKGIDESKIGIVAKNTASNFFYTILLMTDIPVEDFLKKFDLISTQIQIIYSPPPEDQVEMKRIISNTNNETTTHSKKGNQYIKVNIELLDDLINLVGQIIINRNQLLQRSAHIKDQEGNGYLSQMSQYITRLHEKIMHTRLQELDVVYQRVVRIVRDTSKALNKRVELQLDGGEVELDKSVIDVISDCIVHMVRNSIDHGIESPEERIALGKNPIGTIKLKALLQTGNVQVIIEDDGRGLDSEKIKRIAITKGIMTEQEISKMTQNEIYELIFRPGFSTAQVVSETSGRGVGMDVVLTSLRKIGGNVHLQSKLKEGTSISAIIPQTVTVISCLLIKVYNIRYAIFQKNILELIKFEPSLYSMVNGHRMYKLRDKMIPLIHIGNLFFPEEKRENEPEYIVIVKSDTFYYGILFDQMLGTEEIVIKPLGEHFADLKIFSGTTVMGNGETILILDISGIGEFSKLSSTLSLGEKELVGDRKTKKDTGYILFEASGQRFAMSSSSVICIEKISFSKIETIFTTKVLQYKEDIISILQLEDIYHIPKVNFEKESFCIIISVEDSTVGVLIHEVIDIVESISILNSTNLTGPGIIGKAIVKGVSTIVLNPMEIFKREEVST